MRAEAGLRTNPGKQCTSGNRWCSCGSLSSCLIVVIFTQTFSLLSLPSSPCILRNFPDLPPGHLLHLSTWCIQTTLWILTFPKSPPSADTSACHYLISLSMYITSSSALLFLVCLISATCVLIHYLFMTCLPCRSLSFQVATFSVHFHLDLDFTQKL